MVKKDDQLNVRVSRELKEELARMAEAERRSVAFIVQELLREAIEARVAKDASHKPGKGR